MKYYILFSEWMTDLYVLSWFPIETEPSTEVINTAL